MDLVSLILAIINLGHAACYKTGMFLNKILKNPILTHSLLK